MESNSNDNYVLVLEDRTEVKIAQEAGKLSVVSGIDEKGNLKTTEAEATNQASFLKFNSKDGLPKNFMDNFGGGISFSPFSLIRRYMLTSKKLLTYVASRKISPSTW